MFPQIDTVSRLVLSFYDESPFPDYDLDKYRSRLDLEARASWYFKLLDTYIPSDASVIEVGCGTGQLVNFLALKRDRKVFGIDITPRSLKKAEMLRDKMGFDNLTLRRYSIFDLPMPDGEVFDFVFCNGVVHHTYDPAGAFAKLLSLVTEGGYLAVGLYNSIARAPLTRLSRTLRCRRDTIGKAEKVRHLRRFYDVTEFDDYQIDSWFADQFLHPQETTIPLATALRWFKENALAYVNSFPPIELGRVLRNVAMPHLQQNPFAGVSESGWKYTPPALFMRELSWMMKAQNEGGYYVLIGRKGSTSDEQD